METRPHWFVEGTWDGCFEAGDFHRAENLFGSGMRVDGSTLTFCASVALVDRLFHVAWNDRLLVSNSLIQLLARTGAHLDPRHNYRKESFASGYGIKQYPRSFKVLHPEIREIFQDYHCNLIAAEGRIERQVRSRPRRFASFEEYYDALQSALARISDNYRSAARPYYAWSAVGTTRNAAVDRHRSLRPAQPDLRLGSRQPRVPLRVGLCRESAATPRGRRRARPHRDSAARALAISPRIR